MTKIQIPQTAHLKVEIDLLHTYIKDIAPKLAEALSIYHKLRDEHTMLVKQHRERQKELKLLIGDIKILPSHTSTKKSLAKAVNLTKTINKMSAKDKQRLRDELLGG